ncbi:MAG: TonB family protein [Muribaculaceae bacterium]
MFKFLRDNIKYPEEASKNNIGGGCVVVQFIVEADGSVSNIEIVSSVHPAPDAEALRVVSLMPKWNSFDDGPRGICYRLPLYFKRPTEKPQVQSQQPQAQSHP